MVRKLMLAILCMGMLILCSTGVATAATDTQQLTLQQAMDMAMTNSSALKVAQDTIDQQQYSRDAKSQDVSFIPTGQTTPANEQAFLSLVQADMDLQQEKLNYQASKDSVVMQVYQAYDAILQDQVALDAAQQAFNLADLQRRTTTLNCQLGGASKLQLQQANESYTSAQSALTTSQTTLADDYQKFNQLVGLMPDDRPALVDEPAFTPLKIDSLDAEVSRVVETSPALYSKQSAVDKAKIALSIYSYGNTEANTYQGTEKNIDIAQINASTAQDSVAQQVRSLYYSISKLEASHDSLQQKLATAEMNLQIAQIKYATGAASNIDLLTAQSNLTQAKQALLSNICQHQLQAQTFETPWASAS